MPESIYKKPHERTEKKRAEEGNSRKEAALLNRITLLEKEIGCESGKRDERSVKPEP